MNGVILYIEDNPDNMAVVQRAIEAIGYRFEGAVNATDGLRAICEHTPDLLLLDINLPDVDGYAIARWIRQHDNKKISTLPIIAITAYALRGDAEKALDAGCDVFMAKPISIRELWAQVEGFMQNHQPQSEGF
ncbi:MAG: response regulator [Anaerolineaceae bacterium]|jgi:CheY-like chemotaxis protein